MHHKYVAEKNVIILTSDETLCRRKKNSFFPLMMQHDYAARKILNFSMSDAKWLHYRKNLILPRPMQHKYVAGKSLIFSRPIQCSISSAQKPLLAGIWRLEETIGKNQLRRVKIHCCQNFGERCEEMLTKPSQSVVSVLYAFGTETTFGRN